jgi:hypothetical protein
MTRDAEVPSFFSDQKTPRHSTLHQLSIPFGFMKSQTLTAFLMFLLSKLNPHRILSLSKRTMSTSKLPSSMTGPPVAALVPPGECQFGQEFTAVPLMQRFPVSKTSSVLRFGLPDPGKSLQLSTCACILANANIDGEDVTRPYTPISMNAAKGHFDLLIKNYGETAKMSRHMHEIQPGDQINFKHIQFNVKIQAPFDYDHIFMIVGGTGKFLTEMLLPLELSTRSAFHHGRN